MAPPTQRVLQLGFRFEPTPKQAVTYYLPRLTAGERMHAAIRPFIHDADIYACEPGVLATQFRPTSTTGERFFFTACKRQPQKAGKSSRAVRTAGPGSWHSQGHTTDVFDGAGVKVGEAKKFRYKKGGAFTDWLMDEFSCCSEESVVGDRQRVLCKIYVSPKAGPDSAARQESDAAVFAPPAPLEEPVVAPKRPAPPIAEPPSPKRIRVAVVPTPPVVQPSIQTSTVAQAACSPVAARDPFCTEFPAAAQEDDDDFAKILEGTLPCDPFCIEASTAAQEDDGSNEDENYAKILEGALGAGQAEEEAAAEAHGDTDWFASFEPANQQVHEEGNLFAAAMAWEANLMMCA